VIEENSPIGWLIFFGTMAFIMFFSFNWVVMSSRIHQETKGRTTLQSGGILTREHAQNVVPLT